MRTPPFRDARAALRGIAVGIVAAAAFVALHAPIVVPIWDAWPRALAVAAYGGALVGVAHGRFGGAGAAWGAAAALTLVPFLLAGMARTDGASAALWGGMLAILLALLALAWRWLFGAWRRAVAAGAALLALNALPALFLTLITNFHEGTPQPLAMTGVLAGLYVASGYALDLLSSRGPLRSLPASPRDTSSARR